MFRPNYCINNSKKPNKQIATVVGKNFFYEWEQTSDHTPSLWVAGWVESERERERGGRMGTELIIIIIMTECQTIKQ